MIKNDFIDLEWRDFFSASVDDFLQPTGKIQRIGLAKAFGLVP